MNTKPRYYPELDGLRALAALMVMVVHFAQEGIHIPGPVTFGQTGVDLFFVLSGFLITSILLRAQPGDWSEVRTFYLRRSLRIFPLYFVYLLLCSLLAQTPSWQYWVYLQNFADAWNMPLTGPNHFWSLAVEEHFYLVWPFLVLFSPRRWLVKILWSMIAASALLRFVLSSPHLDVYYLTFTRLDGLAAGSLLAVGQKALEFRPRWPKAGIVIFGVLVVVVSLLFRNQGSAWFAAVKYLLITGLYSCVVATLLGGSDSIVGRFLRTKPLRFTGRISYGLYVYHPAVFAFCIAHLAHYPALVQVAASLLAAFAVAMASWYGYERFFIQLKDRWAPEKRLTPRAPVEI